MLDEVLFTLLGLLLAFQVGMMLALKRCEALLHSFELQLHTSNPGQAVEDMRAEVGALVEDVLGSMRPPSIADHLGGVVAQWAQLRMMREMQGSGMLEQDPQLPIETEPPVQ